MGRIHRYGQTKDCLIFNFVATNTIEAVCFAVCWKSSRRSGMLWMTTQYSTSSGGAAAAFIERCCATIMPAKLGDADLEERLLQMWRGPVPGDLPDSFGGLATKRLNLEMLVERRARAQSVA